MISSMQQPQIAIISENTLSSMALRGLLSDIVSGIEIVCYNSIEEFRASECRVVHYFISANILFHNTEMFRSLAMRTMVITDGEASPFVLSGFRTIDATASEHDIVRLILRMHHMGHPGGHHPHQDEVVEGVQPQSLLSARERDVLALLVKGYINKEIADMLNISTPTVIFHRRNLSEKIGSKSIGRQTIYAVMNGIVTPDEL